MNIKYLALLIIIGCGQASSPNKRNGPTRNNQPQNDNPPQDLSSKMIDTIYRDHGTRQYSITELTKLIQENKLPNTVREKPSVDFHADSKVTRPVPIQEDNINCGNVDNSDFGINQRINDCAAKILEPKSSKWLGADNGVAAESTWVLVAKVSNKKVWRDQRTSYIWSSTEGSGSFEWIDALNTTCSNDGTSPSFGMIPKTVAKFRLPSRSDFFQADIDGSRFVLTLSTDTDIYWTASPIDNEFAWAYRLSTGELVKTSISTNLPVICIGRQLK